MGQLVAVGFLVALVVVLGVLLRREIEKKRSLDKSLQAARTELERFAPIRDVDREVAQRRRTLAEEIDQANRQIESARRGLDVDVRQKRQEAEAENAALNARMETSRKGVDPLFTRF